MQLSIAKKRIAVIDYDKCDPVKCGGYYCERVCPVNRTDKKCIYHEGKEKPLISEELCIGCMICVKACPFGAISIINLSIDPGYVLHQFGQNLFRIHGVALPKQGKVVGLLGRNGTGKTTITKILSGQVVPNLGAYDGDGSWETVLEFFRGKEIREFFEGVSAGSARVSIKPQNVEAIPKNFRGSVQELLEKVDGKNAVQEISGRLGLNGILARPISKVSGGELQKVAIAAAALKDADLYFFDEPSSYLDIRERLKVAEFISEIAESGKSVMVVEHDLIIMDFLTDFVHLMYGAPGVYGMLSQIKNSREGINDYLEGYSREENYRFRDKPIKFDVKGAKEMKRLELLAEWPELEKRLDGFELKVEANRINKNEVVGVLGPNGIGKSTFAKMLVSEIRPDNTGLDVKRTISYKPQYIAMESDKTVLELFKENGAEISDPDIKSTITSPLGVDELLEKSVSTLSGGEMQRVAIALCLARKSDLILMDEPSAHLDIEQRLNVAKVIRNIVEGKGVAALIIDHDLLFLDYISDRLMVFSGEPSKKGLCQGPFPMEKGMNLLLKELDITLRRDERTKRPRINKRDSVKDREQKKSGKYYYE
ncbi:MAG: ribosome biogenesis/translation initiation ATPase RLI [Candidatus Diapherotrites archaeon]|nr:ribosome biogenesis/translation initiation ATPase RLI [Candidatus Diapherotrites archaeon]